MEKTILLKFKTLGHHSVNFPNVGEIMEIESLKMALTTPTGSARSTYGDMVRSGTLASSKVLDLVDSISFFSVLAPDIRSKLNVNSYTEMNQFVAKEIVNVYTKQFFPWYNELNKSLQEYGQEKTEE